MTNFEIKRNGKKFILDIGYVKHIFVTEDETCAEVTLTLADIKRLEVAVANGKKVYKPWEKEE